MTLTTTYDWPLLTATSHYETLVAIEEAVRNEDYDEARQGLEELLDDMSRSNLHALESHLVVLMTHVIKWLSQPECRSQSWRLSINNARREIRRLQRHIPSLTDEVIERIWDNAFVDATAQADDEMEKSSTIPELKWQQVFEDNYVWSRQA